MTLSSTEPPLWQLILVPNIINILVLVALYVSMIVYYSRRNYFPIKGRGNRAILFCGCLYSVVLISNAARGPGYPCWIDQIAYCIVSHCASAVYVYRVAVLLIRQEIADEIQLGYIRRLSSPLAPRSCLHHPRFHKLLKFRRWVIVLFIYGVVVGVVSMAAILALGDRFECNNPVNIYSNVVLLVIIAPIMGAMSFKLRKYPSDGRKISSEFRSMAIVIIVALVVQNIILQTTSIQFTSIYLRVIVGFALLATSMLYPLYLSYGGWRMICRRNRQTLTASNMLTLEDLLNMQDFRVAFLVHLKSEFNAESLIFWESATFFKCREGTRTQEEMITEIEDLMETYLAEDAPYLLNTSGDLIEDSKARFERAKESGAGFLNVFDGLLNEVVLLMKSDPLPRFFRTSAGRQFLVNYDPSSSRRGLDGPPSSHQSINLSVMPTSDLETPRRNSNSIEL